MKKTIAAIIGISIVSLSVTPALAHGSHHGRATRASYSVCTTEYCTQAGLHTHNGKSYAAHYFNDGHNYHYYGRGHH